MTSKFILSEDQLKKIHENFKQGDENADEKLSLKEFFCVSQKLQLGLSGAQIRDIFKNADADQSGALSFAEFLTTYFSLADKSSRIKISNLAGISALDEGTLGELRAFFYDKKSNKGKVTRMECLSMLRKFGIGLKTDEINRLFKLADDDSDNMISYEEFKHLAIRQGSNKPVRSNPVLRERFLKYDSDGDEKLNRLEFQELLNYFHMPLDKRSLAKVFRAVDINKDGNISWEEFHEIYPKIQGLPGWTETAAIDYFPDMLPSARQPFEQSPVQPSVSTLGTSKGPSSISSLFSSEGSDISRRDVLRACSYFWSADKNGDGRLNRDEFGSMVRSLKLNMNEGGIDKAFKKADKDNSKTISFSEFTASFLNKKKKQSFTPGEVQQMFHEMDENHNGYLSIPVTLKALKKLGCKIEEAPLTSILYNMDENNDGKVTLSEFCAFLDICE